MREKLLDLMKSEGLKSSQLADMLGVNPAGISHILAGRNKPGFDLLQKILRRFPRISPDWLLLDSGPMYRDMVEPGIPVNNDNAELAAQTLRTREQERGLGNLFTPNRASAVAESETTVAPEDRRLPKPQTSTRSANRPSDVKSIVVLYEDGTFESYLPTMH